MEGVTAESSLSALSHRTPGGLRRTRQMESAAIDVVALWRFRARRLGTEHAEYYVALRTSSPRPPQQSLS